MDELKVLKRAEMLMTKLYGPVMNYPRPARQVIGQNVLSLSVDLHKNISIASSVKSMRKKKLQEADGCLESLRAIILLSKNKKCISKGFYREVSEELTIIKSQIVQMIKSTTK